MLAKHLVEILQLRPVHLDLDRIAADVLDFLSLLLHVVLEVLLLLGEDRHFGFQLLDLPLGFGALPLFDVAPESPSPTGRIAAAACPVSHHLPLRRAPFWSRAR